MQKLKQFISSVVLWRPVWPQDSYKTDCRISSQKMIDYTYLRRGPVIHYYDEIIAITVELQLMDGCVKTREIDPIMPPRRVNDRISSQTVVLVNIISSSPHQRVVASASPKDIIPSTTLERIIPLHTPYFSSATQRVIALATNEREFLTIPERASLIGFVDQNAMTIKIRRRIQAAVSDKLIQTNIRAIGKPDNFDARTLRVTRIR